jgi:hypothetical protein
MISKKYDKLRFMGLSLGGGKSSKTHLAVVDYFPSEKKLFLTHLFRDIGEQEGLSGDTVLVDLIKENREQLHSIAVDAPLIAPVCVRCKVPCVGVEQCKKPEILWMWEHHQSQDKHKRPNKIFTPYTERCVEQYLNTSLEQPFQFDHALGSNRAPLWARMVFLSHRLKQSPLIEVFPRLNTWRVGRALKLSKNTLLNYKNSIGGAQHRQHILDKFVDSEWLFIYSQDAKHMVKDAHMFEAVLSGFTAYLHYKKLCENPPKGFPRDEAWVSFPRIDFPESIHL